MNKRQALKFAKKLYGEDAGVAHLRAKAFRRKDRFVVGLVVTAKEAASSGKSEGTLSVLGASHVSWEGAFVDAHQFFEKAQKRAAEIAAEKAAKETTR